MSRGRVIRFGIATALFLGWLGYLGFLVLTSRNPVILSRPQLLVSEIDIIGRIDEPDKAEVRVEEVWWPKKDGQAKLKEGEVIRVTNLDDCRPLQRINDQWVRGPRDLTGPGEYILPLVLREGKYEVASIPPSPGFIPVRGRDTGPPRIYPLTADTRAQLEKITKPSP